MSLTSSGEDGMAWCGSIPGSAEMICYCLEAFRKRVMARHCEVSDERLPRHESVSSLAAGAYRISVLPDGRPMIEHHGVLGLLAGLGKVLRGASYAGGCFRYGVWEGECVPVKPYRIAYLASHFNNVYQNASEAFLEDYIVDLAMVGYNYLALVSSAHVFKSLDDPGFTELLRRNRQLYLFANSLGMRIHLSFGNCGLASVPESIRAVPTGHSFFGVEVCLSKPEGIAYLQELYRHIFEAARGVDVGLVCAWSYDQGGCGCPQCAPFGVRGMYKMIDALWPLAQSIWPEAKLVQAAWEFDLNYKTGTDRSYPEWKAMYEHLRSDAPNRASIIMADSHGDFPEFPLAHGLPQGVQLITFPEISMHGRSPWGSFGATPMPRRFQKIWGQVMHLASGGRIYSEGIYEDFNKFLFGSFFVSGGNDIDDCIEEYARYFWGAEDMALVRKIFRLMEEQHAYVGFQRAEDGRLDGDIPAIQARVDWHPDHAQELLDTVMALDAQLPDYARRGWRWRQMVLRAVIDADLAAHGGQHTDTTEEALEELGRLYGANELTTARVAPFSRSWRMARKRRFQAEALQYPGIDIGREIFRADY